MEKNSCFVFNTKDKNQTFKSSEKVEGELILYAEKDLEVSKVEAFLYGIESVTFHDTFEVEEEAIHINITCNGCGKRHWKGKRWHCQKCNYDLCEECQGKESHTHKLEYIPPTRKVTKTKKLFNENWVLKPVLTTIWKKEDSELKLEKGNEKRFTISMEIPNSKFPSSYKHKEDVYLAYGISFYAILSNQVS